MMGEGEGEGCLHGRRSSVKSVVLQENLPNKWVWKNDPKKVIGQRS